MENKEEKFQFKTNINCSGCVATIKPHFDKEEEICEWNVDVSSKNKVLTVKGKGISQERLIDIIYKAGFKAESLS